MQLLAGLHHSEQWQALLQQSRLPLTQQLSAQTPAALASALDITALANLLAEHSQLHILLCYDAPERVIAALLNQGMAMTAALEHWQGQTTALLALQQQQRRRLQLVQTDAVLQQTADIPAWLQQALTPAAQPEQPGTVELLLAAQGLRQHKDAAKLAQRLQASSLAQPHASLVLNLNLIQQQLADNSKADMLQSQLSASNDERDLLLQQLLHVQEELEQLFQKKQTVKQQYSQLEQDYRTEVAGLSAKLQQGEQTVEKTASQLQHLQQELTRITAAHNSLQQQYAQATAQLSASNDERDLLLQQLLHVQEELEQYYLKNQQLVAEQARHNQLQQQIKALQAQLTKATADYQAEHKQNIALQKQRDRSQSKLEQQLKVAIAEAARAKHQASALSNELEAIKKTTLWKSGAPVRKLARVFGKGERERQQIQQDAALIITSEYFDLTWYLNTYPDVAQAGINPAEHYLRYGTAEGRYPGPLFDGNWYLQRYPDVAAAGLNPLLHYIKFGRSEGRTASPMLLANTAVKAGKAKMATKKGTKK